MSDKSKLSLVTVIVSIATAIAYTIYALGPKAPAINDIQAWAVVLLIYIGITIVIMILVQILFRITLSIGIAAKNQEKSEADVNRIVENSMKEDEMDVQINLRSLRMNYIIGGFGCVAALVLLAIDIQVVYVLHTIFGSCFLGGLAEGITSIYYYEKGI